MNTEELWPNASAIVRDRTRLRLGCLTMVPVMGFSDGLWVLEIWWIDISKIFEKGCTGGLTIKETSSS